MFQKKKKEKRRRRKRQRQRDTLSFTLSPSSLPPSLPFFPSFLPLLFLSASLSPLLPTCLLPFLCIYQISLEPFLSYKSQKAYKNINSRLHFCDVHSRKNNFKSELSSKLIQAMRYEAKKRKEKKTLKI